MISLNSNKIKKKKMTRKSKDKTKIRKKMAKIKKTINNRKIRKAQNL